MLYVHCIPSEEVDHHIVELDCPCGPRTIFFTQVVRRKKTVMNPKGRMREERLIILHNKSFVAARLRQMMKEMVM